MRDRKHRRGMVCGNCGKKVIVGDPYTESGEGGNPSFVNFERFERKQARLVELEILKKDERLPETVRSENQGDFRFK
ncbi:MAG: hypothetical protein IMZ52_03345 [Actinobacteria bacterium]|nr:hypothetical protein [Actinomycetota bacterium]MBE3123151.1 hypothetical protein [Thermoplasmata archaeon]